MKFRLEKFVIGLDVAVENAQEASRDGFRKDDLECRACARMAQVKRRGSIDIRAIEAILEALIAMLSWL